MPQQILLSNGISVILENRPWAKSVAISIGMHIGSRHGKEPGLIYATMQMLLQGTKAHSATEIFTRIESVGGSLGVTVDRDLTLIQTRVPKKDLETGLKTLFEIVSSPAFSEESFSAIQNKMVGQVLARENNGMRKSVRIAYESAFPSTPIGYPILGYPSSISNLNISDCITAFERSFNPKDLIVAVVGAFDRNHLIDLLHQTFERLIPQNMDSKKIPDDSIVSSTTDSDPQELIIEADEKTQAHIILGFRSLPILDKRLPALLVANHILGATMSSRLFTQIREIRGLAYTTYSMISSFQDIGYTHLYAGVRPDGILDTLSTFHDELKKISSQPVPNDELNQNRSHILGQIRLAHESTAFTANWLAIQRIRRGILIDPQEIRQQIENVTQEDILNACQSVFLSPQRNTVIVGAVDPGFQLPKKIEDYQIRRNSK